MTKEELSRFINLLIKLEDNPYILTWGEINELRDFKYKYSDYIQKEWENWG